VILRSIFIFLLTVFSTQVSAQQLIYIPDANLRKALKDNRFTTKDSLDTYKVRGRLQLELNNKGIQNLDGLQYFERLWKLEINNNEIESLIYLPPNLTSLSCTNNKLTVIDSLPKKLKVLNCSNNKISRLENLPEFLEYIDFRNNALTYFPVIPRTKLDFVNYYNNPIPYDSLPLLYQETNCNSYSMNCLPNKLRKWHILQHNIKQSEIEEIIKIEAQFLTFYNGQTHSSGFKSEDINFNPSEEYFTANEIITTETINYYEKDTTKIKTVKPFYSTFRNSKIKEILNDIYINNLIISAPLKDSIVTINFEHKKRKNNELISIPSRSSHDTSYNLFFSFTTHSRTIKLKYYFSDSYFITLQSQETSHILNWLYMYKLVNLCFSNHEVLNNVYFRESNLNRIIKWHNDYDEKSKSN
jgi:hypothetical protein